MANILRRLTKDIESERIFRYYGDGTLDDCVYEERALSGENLIGLTCVDDSVYFGIVSGSDIGIMRIDPQGGATLCRSYQWEDSKKSIHNIAMLMAGSINENDIAALNTPESYMEAAYRNINAAITPVLKNDINAENGIYCLLYKVRDNIVYEAYSDEKLHGTGYIPWQAALTAPPNRRYS